MYIIIIIIATEYLKKFQVICLVLYCKKTGQATYYSELERKTSSKRMSPSSKALLPF